VSRRKKVKPGYLGAAFYEWLAHLEMCEDVVLRNKTRDHKRASRGYSFNNELFPISEGVQITGMNESGQTMLFGKTVAAMLPVDAWVAHLVRSSVKYRITHDTMLELNDKYAREIEYIQNTMIVELPYDPITVVFEGVGPKDDDVLVNICATTATNRGRIHGAGDGTYAQEFLDVDYPALGIGEGDEFLSATICFHRAAGVTMEDDNKVRPDQKLSHCPVEIHCNKGLPLSDTKWINAIAPGADMGPRGRQMIEETRQMIVYFLTYFRLASVLRRKQPGIPPALAAQELKRKKPKHRNKRNRPMFEHFVIEMEVDEPEPGQSNITRAPHKKKAHPVQGHERTYKSGKKTWVKPHWRGDKKLGVVRKDFEMTTHDFDGDSSN
jgi:hypothetical protein